MPALPNRRIRTVRQAGTIRKQREIRGGETAGLAARIAELLRQASLIPSSTLRIEFRRSHKLLIVHGEWMMKGLSVINQMLAITTKVTGDWHLHALRVRLLSLCPGEAPDHNVL